MYEGSGYRYRHTPVPAGNATRVGIFLLTAGYTCRWALWGNGQIMLESDLRENALAFADAMMVGIERGCVTLDDQMFLFDPVYHDLAGRAVYSILEAERLAQWFEQS